MAENVVISFQADTAGLVPAINLLESVGAINSENAEKFRKATQDYTNQLNQRVNATKGAFTQLNQAVNSVKADNGLAKALDQSAPVVKTANSVVNLRTEVKQAVVEAQNLAAAYGDLDPRAVAAAKRASELKDQLADVNSRINALNPEAKFQAIAGVASGIAGAFTAAQGALALFGAESEDVQKALLKVQGALALSQGINQVLGLKDAFTNLKAVLGLTSAAQAAATIQTEALAGAQVAEAVAAETAAGANKAFAASLSATGIGAILVVLGAVAAAFVSIKDEADDAAASAKALTDLQARNRLLASDALTTEEKLKVLKGEITQFDAERNQLQREYIKDNQKLYQDQITNARQIQEAEDKIANLRQQNIGLQQGTQTDVTANIIVRNQKEIEAEQKKLNELKKFREQYVAAINIVEKKKQDQYAIINQNEIEDNKKKEEEKTKKLKEEAEKRAKLLLGQGDQGAINKKNFDNAILLIGQYYDQDRLLAQENIADKEERRKKLVEIEIAEKREIIEAAKAFFQDYTNLQIELNNFIEQNQPPPIVVDFAGLRKQEFDRALGLINQYYDEQALLAEKSIPDAEKRAKELEKIELERLREQLKAAQENGQDTVALERRITALLNGEGDNRTAAIKSEGEKRSEIIREIYDTSLGIIADQLNAQFELEQQAIEDRLEAQQEAADREAEINQSKYEKGIIGIKEFRDTEKQIEEERKRAQEEAAKKTAEIKRKQDIASRAQAIFEIAVATAANIAKSPGLFPPGGLIPFWIGLGALQAGAVLARPLPKYEKGTLSLKRGNNPLGTDTIPIMANEGEAIIPTGKARAYRPTLEALYKGLLSPAELNGLVRRKLSDKSERSVPVDYDVMASKLGSEIAWRLRGRDGVVVKNVSEFANALSAVPLINRNR